VVGDEYQGAVGVGFFHATNPENVHQIVGRKIDPQAPNMPLKKRHEAFHYAEVHTVGEPEPESLVVREHADLFAAGEQRYGVVMLEVFAVVHRDTTV
jgi:hypothetical protein